MKVVADDKIPFLRGVLETEGIEVVYEAGAKITRDTLRDADALITRTRTKCRAELLDGTKVRFIATATIGFDHLDTAYLAARKIAWTNAPGCNSSSVAQYLVSTLLHLAVKHRFALRDKTLGVVGVGNVGKKVAAAARALGMNVLLNDPPRARAEGAAGFVGLSELAERADILTFHVPLEREGSDPTFHLAGETFLQNLAPGKILINSSRGEVADNAALKRALQTGRLAGAVLDVWENEPEIDRELMTLLDFSTPHVAGYSTDGKANGTSMSVNALAEFFHWSDRLKQWRPDNVPLPDETVSVCPETGTTEENLLAAVRRSYDVAADSARLREAPENFEKQRGSYPLRREFPAFSVRGGKAAERAVLARLGFRLI